MTSCGSSRRRAASSTWAALRAPGLVSRGSAAAGVKIVGIDLQPVENYVGEAIEGSILEVPASRFLELLGGRARLVMSDMAPSTNGNKSSDHLRQIELVRMAFSVTQEVLAHDGAFVAKIFDGSEVPALMAELKPWFRDIKRIRPEAVRQESREFFIAGLGFKRPAEPVRGEIDAPSALS